MLTQLLKGQASMSDAIAKFDAKLNELAITVNGKLSAAETARNAAVSELATTKTTLADVQAKLAAIPNDTAALEAQIEAETAKVSGIIDKLNGIDTTPVSVPPSEPTATTQPADTTPKPVPTETPAPAAIDPAAPTGKEVAL